MRLSVHELVAGRRAGSAKCKKCLQVCGCQWRAYLGKPKMPSSSHSHQGCQRLVRYSFDQEEAELQSEDDKPQIGLWQPALKT